MKKDQLHERRDFKDVRELVEWAAKEYGDSIAYSFKPDPHKTAVISASFNELRDDVRALGSELISMGCAGKHCVVIGKFSYDWIRMYFALLKK